jgi:molybdenum cofactor synthesis domain-containing protein
VLSEDGTMLPSIGQALTMLRAAIGEPGRQIETVPTEAGRGRVLAVDLRTLSPQPPNLKAATDGFAVRYEELVGTNELRIRRPRKSAPLAALHRGEAVYVKTGKTLPAGSNTIVPAAQAEIGPSSIHVTGPINAGEAVINIGSELGAGEVILPVGTLLRSSHLGILAGFGFDTISVFQRPSVAIISTGEEVVAPGRPRSQWQIYDVNRYVIFAALSVWGAQPAMFPGARNDHHKLSASLELALAHCDAVILSGGSTVKTSGLIARSIRAIATKTGVVVDGIRMHPGQRTILGAVGAKPIIGLPGEPIAATVALYLLGQPVIRRLGGQSVLSDEVSGLTSALIIGKPGWDSFAPVAADGTLYRPTAVDLSYFTTFREATGIVHIPAVDGFLASGSHAIINPIA